MCLYTVHSFRRINFRSLFTFWFIHALSSRTSYNVTDGQSYRFNSLIFISSLGHVFLNKRQQCDCCIEMASSKIFHFVLILQHVLATQCLRHYQFFLPKILEKFFAVRLYILVMSLRSCPARYSANDKLQRQHSKSVSH